MDCDELVSLRANSPEWRLLRADNSPLVLSVLGRIFVTENVRSVSATDLTARVDDELYALNNWLGVGTFPRAATAYLDDWSSAEVGWLRKFYPPGTDEPHFDATPAVVSALPKPGKGGQSGTLRHPQIRARPRGIPVGPHA